jgi:hypothetical integral membrane protein (TIGR02206 family)
MESFRAFSVLHAVVLAVIAVLTAVAITLRRRRGGVAAAPSRAERAIGGFYLAIWVATFVWLLFPPRHDPATTYPLQLCHLCGAAAALVLLSPQRGVRAVLYFCGLGLCAQALITPALSEGPAFYPFWFFWGTHGMIVGVAVYDVVARGFRPGLRDYGVACIVAAIYVAAVLPIDVALGWNYGFVGPSRPGVPSIVDLLGPWPQRLLLIAAIAAAAMGSLLVPWIVAGRPAARPAR